MKRACLCTQGSGLVPFCIENRLRFRREGCIWFYYSRKYSTEDVALWFVCDGLRQNTISLRQVLHSEKECLCCF